MPIPIDDQPVTIIFSGAPGPGGKSAYQSYLDTTSDDPVLSEAAWSAPRIGTAITIDSDGIASFVDGASITRRFVTYLTDPYP